MLGFDPRRLLNSFFFLPKFSILTIKFLIKYYSISEKKFKLEFLPVLSDAMSSGGVARGHYFHQDLWAARQIYTFRPKLHVDVGSRIDGFIAHLLVFMSVTILDIRQVNSRVSGLTILQADITSHSLNLKLKSDSISCLHALEHFGLGRYGDPINLNGWKDGLTNLVSMLLPGGRLYISVPIGNQVIEYNNQRIFAVGTIVEELSVLGMQLEQFSYIDDFGNFHANISPLTHLDCKFGCGCFQFIFNS
jgi:hypothetical protein